MKTPPDTLKDFTNYLYARSGMRDSSIMLMAGYIRRMLPETGYIRRMLPETGPKPSAKKLDEYIASLRKKKISNGHLANAMKSIEHFTVFIGRPTKFQRPRRQHNPNIKVLSEGKTTLIIAATSNIRERMIIMLLAYTGCRNQELVNLCIRDVNVSQQELTIQNSKGADRICPLAGDCIELLAEYLRERQGGPDDYLFVTKRHRHQMQTQDIRKIIKVVARRANIPTRVWPHLFRHSLATAMSERGAPAPSIQAILGHAYVSTTIDYYLHPNARNVKSDYHRYAPSFF